MMPPYERKEKKNVLRRYNNYKHNPKKKKIQWFSSCVDLGEMPSVLSYAGRNYGM
jgi:hypothetical protein